MEGTERDLFDLLVPHVASRGADLVEIALAGSRGRTIVRLVIHSGAGVSHADCARVTRACSSAIDEAEALGGSYSLEVSSPGLDRVLKSGREFDVFRGLRVRVRLVEGEERAGTCAGTSGEEGVVLVGEDGSESVIPWSRVAKARLAPDPEREFGGKRK